MRVFGIVGFKNSGKTRLLTELVGELVARGLRVATVKHAHHAFDIDHEGTDSRLHRQAGADQVIVASAARWAHIRELRGAEPGLEELLTRIEDADLVLVEGYKGASHPKLQVVRDAGDRLLAADDPAVVAVVSDLPLASSTVPVIGRAALARIVDTVLRDAAAVADWRRGSGGA